jgi:large subunit ribosomal protein L15
MLTPHQLNLVQRKKKKRVGRGISAGQGKTCGRGTKGQKARYSIRPGFEGGQMPFHQRIPKHKGFFSRFKVKFQVLNLSDLEKFFQEGETVNLESLLKKKVIQKIRPLKILGDGELKKALTVEAQAFSNQAKQKIEAVKGKTLVVKLVTQEQKPKEKVKSPETKKKTLVVSKTKKPSLGIKKVDSSQH